MKGVSFSRKLKTLFAGDEAIDKLSKARKPSTSKLDDILDGVVEPPKQPVEESLKPKDIVSETKEAAGVGEQPLNNETKPKLKPSENANLQTGEFARDEDFSEFLRTLAGKKYSSNQDVQKILDVLSRDFDSASKSPDISNILKYYEKLESRHERFILKPDKKETAGFISEVMSAFEKYLTDKHGITVRKSAKGDIFDPSVMRKIDTVNTADKALDGTIESIYHSGFLASNGDELRPLRVNVYEYSQG